MKIGRTSRLWDVGLRVLISASMVLGMVPSQALAEMVDAPEQALEEELVEVTPEEVEEAPVVVEEGEIAAEEEAAVVTEEPAVADEPEAVAEEPAEVSEQSAETAETPAAPAENPEQTKASAEASTAPISEEPVLVAAEEGDISFDVLTLDEQIDVSFDSEGGAEYVVFTAPSSGTYDFSIYNYDWESGGSTIFADAFGNEDLSDFVDGFYQADMDTTYSATLVEGDSLYFKVTAAGEATGYFKVELREEVVPVDLVLGEAAEASAISGSYWIGRFTAEVGGTYSFYSEGDYDTYGELYADEDLSSCIESNDDGGSNGNFLITRALSEGETVYLKVRQYGDGSFTCTVFADNRKSITNASWTFAHTTFAEDGMPHQPMLEYFTDYDYETEQEIDLVEGTDYVVRFKDYEGNELATAPTAEGQYYAVYEGINRYRGSFEQWFKIGGRYDLSGGTIDIERDTYYTYGDPIVMPVTVRNIAGDVLVEGTDYTLSYQRYDEMGDLVAYTGALSEPGEYQVQAIGAGSYTEQTSAYWFYIYDAYSLARGRTSLDNSWVKLNNGSAVPQVSVYDGNGELLSADNYTLEYAEYNSGYQTLSGAPTTEGSFYVRAVGVSPYRDTTSWRSFEVYDPHNLSYGWVSLSGNSTFPETGNPISPRFTVYVDDDDTSRALAAGTDYVIEYFTYDDNGEEVILDAAPSAAGIYNARAKGQGDYHGYTSAMSLTIVAANDLTGGRIEFSDYEFGITGNPIDLQAAVYDVLGNQLTEGSDYELEYSYEDSETWERVVLDGAPSAEGEYYVRAHGVNAYTGYTSYSGFRIVDTFNLNEGHMSFQSREYEVTGNPVIPQLYVYDALGELVPESGYVLEYRTSDGSTWSTTAPSAIGTYYVHARGVDPYKQSTSYSSFTIYDPYDLSSGYVYLDTSRYAGTGESVDLEAMVYDRGGDTIAGRHYTFEYQVLGQSGSWEDLEGVPSELGSYRVRATAAGAPYTNSTPYVSFEILDGSDLTLGRLYVRTSRISNEQTTDDLRITVRDVQGYRVNSQHYNLQYQAYDSDQNAWVDLNAAPTVVGTYRVRAVATGDQYKGTTNIEDDDARFTIYDVRDLSNGRVSSNISYYADPANPFTLTATVYDGSSNVLPEGAYTLAYEVQDRATNEWTSISGAPTAVGYYRVKAVATTSSGYTGETGYYGFNIYDRFTLDAGWASQSSSIYAYTGEPVVPSIVMYDYFNNALIAGVDYEVQYFTSNEVALDGAPSDRGAYIARFQGIGNYSGTFNMQFEIGHESPVVAPIEVGLGETSVTVSSGSYWVGAFTATSNGTYSFTSTGNYDSYGELFGDSALSSRLTSNDDGGEGGNFAMSYRLSAGQTVYLKVRQYSNSSMRCVVHIAEGSFLVNCSYSYDEGTFVYDGAGHAPEVTFSDNGYVLVEGTDYKLAGYTTSGGSAIEGMPTMVGSYQVVYEGIGSYSGKRSVSFRIIDGADLSDGSISLESSSAFLGENDSKPEVTVTDARGNTLVEGTDYVLKYYESEDGSTYPLKDAITETGRYAVRAVAAPGGAYCGRTSMRYFTVYNPQDISASSRYSFYFTNSSRVEYTGKPVVLPNITAYSTVDGVSSNLVLDRDYAIKGYQDEAGRTLTEAPSEVGYYYVVLEGMGDYTGTRTLRFTIADSYDLAGYQAYALDGIYPLGPASGSAFLFTGSPIEPTLLVRGYNGELTKDVDYTVTFSGNDAIQSGASSAVATATLTGKGEYHGTLTCRFELVRSIDISRYISSYGVEVTWDGSTQHFYGGTDGLEYLANGSVIKPAAGLEYCETLNQQFVAGTDYSVSYVDGNGNEVNPTELGIYYIKLAAIEGSVLSGSTLLQYRLVDKVSIARSNISLDYAGRYGTGYSSVPSFTIYDVGATEQSIGWSISNSFGTLIEGLDYVVSVVHDEINHLLTFTFTGVNSYEGTVRAKVYMPENGEDQFATASMTVNGVYENPVVYLDEDGVLEVPAVRLYRLVSGTDFAVTLTDADGNALSTAAVGDKVLVTASGLGAYAGSTRSMWATVEAGSDLMDLSSSSATMGIDNLAYGRKNGTSFATLLKGVTPQVSVSVYSRNVVLTEGYGFTVSTEVSADGATMNVIASGDEDMMTTGSKSMTVQLVDAYDVTNLFDEVTVSSGGISERYAIGSTATIRLPYQGVPYLPGVSFAGARGVAPTVQLTLKDSAGKQVSNITGAGNYTLSAAGTGLWSGTVTIPLSVYASDTPLSVRYCGLELGDLSLTSASSEPELVALATSATPKVTLRYGSYTFVEGTDYKVEYFNNTTDGAHASVKVTALEGGLLSGSITRQFIVGGVTGKNLAYDGYTLMLAMPGSTTSFASASNTVRMYPVDSKGVAAPVVKISQRSGGYLDSANYAVEYGNNTAGNLAYVKVTGKNGYSGSLSANYYAVGAAAQRIDLSGATVTASNQTYNGKAHEPAVKVVFGGKTLVAGTDYIVAYSNNTNAGKAIITVNGTGLYKGAATGTFTISRAKATVTANSATKVFGAADPALTATVSGVVEGDSITYTVTRAAGDNVGTYAITAAGNATQGNYSVTYAVGTFTITAKPIDAAELSGITAEVTYTGSAIRQTPVVKLDGATLVAGTDYDVTYANNTNAGTATLTVTAKGNYTGKKTATYAIVAKSLNGAEIATIENQPIGATPVPVITLDGKTLVAGTDFTVEYKGNDAVGTATANITGKGNYAGTLSATFQVMESIAEATVTVAGATYTGKALAPRVTVTLGEAALAEGTDYEVVPGSYVNAGSHEVSVRGIGSYAGTATGTFKVSARAISKATVAAIANKTYTGSAIKPAPTVKDGTRTLKSGTDYTVAYKDNVKAGTATVTVKGKGNYSGSKSVTFKIAAASVAKTTVSKIANQKYDGKAKTPRPTVKVGTRTLKLNTDYTLTYKNNTKAGTATVTIKGKGNYAGSKSVTFKIVAMAGTWKKSGSRWWYQWKDGKYPKSVFLDISGKTYRFDASGWMLTGWQQISGKYYYFGSDGVMRKNTWAGNYWLGANGVMATNAWVDGGKYYVGANGAWVKGKTR